MIVRFCSILTAFSFGRPAEQYLAKPGNTPYCSAEPTGIPLPPPSEWLPDELEERFAPKLPPAFWAVHGPSVGARHCNLRAPNQQIVWKEEG